MIAVCDIIPQEKKIENNEIYDSKEVEIGIGRETDWRMKDSESPTYACLKVPGRSSKLLSPIDTLLINAYAYVSID
jgi:hypothetical protein